MTGMEMLIQSLLKASGVDPEKVKADVMEYGRKLSERIASMDESVKGIQTSQAVTLETLQDLRKGQITLSELMLEISRATAQRNAQNGVK